MKAVLEFGLACWKYFKKSIIEMGPGSDLRYHLKSTQDKEHSIHGTLGFEEALEKFQ